MKCYNRHDQDAVGVCKSCLKRVCAECTTDIGVGITCSVECQSNAEDAIAMLKIQLLRDWESAPLFYQSLKKNTIMFNNHHDENISHQCV